jgi:hypothetical protein
MGGRSHAGVSPGFAGVVPALDGSRMTNPVLDLEDGMDDMD